jgi:hypothetical protein
MMLCGVSRIDDLHGGAPAGPIGPGEEDRNSVGIVQQMLAGMGLRGLPNLLSPDYGMFGPRTMAAVRAGCDVDSECLRALVQATAPEPVASRGYVTLVLDFPYSGLVKILCVVAQMEGAGRFGAMNLNTDKAGLSFGLIQWAQKPGRLAEILRAFALADPVAFAGFFTGGDANLAAEFVAHVKLPAGGVDSDTGETTNPAFDLVREPWVSRFQQAALFKPYQQVQVKTALEDFAGSLKKIQSYAPQLTSERAVGFMIDLANQFGDAGAQNVYQSVAQQGVPVEELLQAVAEESVARLADPFKAGTQARRQHFLTTEFLSDAEFENTVASTSVIPIAS